MKRKTIIIKWFRKLNKKKIPLTINNDKNNKKVITKDENTNNVINIKPKLPITNNTDNVNQKKEIKKNHSNPVPEQPLISKEKVEKKIKTTPPTPRKLENKLNPITDKKMPDNNDFNNKENTKKERKQIEVKPQEIEKKEHPIPVPKKLDNDVSIILPPIINELDKMLKTEYYEVKKIQYDLDILEKKEKDEVLENELNKIIEKLQKLLDYFEKVKKEVYKQYPDALIKNFDSGYIKELLEEYKTLAINGNVANATILQIKQINEYVNIINEIINIENRANTLNNQLDDKKRKIVGNEKDFEKFESHVDDIEKTNNYIASFAKTQEQILKNIESKLSESEKVTKTIKYKNELVLNYSKLFNATLLTAVTPLIPATKGGFLIRTGLMICAITNLARLYSVKIKGKETSVNVNYIDYEKDIKKNINNVDDMTLMISNALIDLKYLKKTFSKDFGEYSNLIPEYYDMLIKLNDIEKDLLIKESMAKEYNNKLNESLNNNNVKIKRIEEEYRG